jgi:hypothetical protein
LLIRAARHYEGAMQILIRHAVMTGRQVGTFPFIQTLTTDEESSDIFTACTKVDKTYIILNCF